MKFQQDDMPALRTIVTEELLTGALLECRTREHILATLRQNEVSKAKWAKTYSLSLKRSVSAVPTQTVGRMHDNIYMYATKSTGAIDTIYTWDKLTPNLSSGV
jgi:hypothetical protein